MSQWFSSFDNVQVTHTTATDAAQYTMHALAFLVSDIAAEHVVLKLSLTSYLPANRP